MIKNYCSLAKTVQNVLTGGARCFKMFLASNIRRDSYKYIFTCDNHT